MNKQDLNALADQVVAQYATAKRTMTVNAWINEIVTSIHKYVGHAIYSSNISDPDIHEEIEAFCKRHRHGIAIYAGEFVRILLERELLPKEEKQS